MTASKAVANATVIYLRQLVQQSNPTLSLNHNFTTHFPFVLRSTGFIFHLTTGSSIKVVLLHTIANSGGLWIIFDINIGPGGMRDDNGAKGGF